MLRDIGINHVSKTFAASGPAPVVALDPISLHIKGGEFVSLIGPSGCGKTTLLRIIAGLLPPSGGNVQIDGVVVTQPNPGVSFVFQKATLLPWRTVMQNCLLPVQVTKSAPLSEARDRAVELLNLTGLWDFRNRYPRELSGGMQQRVAIARALMTEPEILLMDEPFGALDEFTRDHLNEELLRLRQLRPNTVVFVTHNIGEAVFMSDRIAVMAPRPGRLGKVIDVPLPEQRDSATRRQKEYFEVTAATRAVFDALHLGAAEAEAHRQ